MIGGGGEESAALGVLEAFDHCVGERGRLAVPARIAGRLVQAYERLEQERVVLEEAADAGGSQ